ncbi:hypothetical protein BH11MYX4_BH11MYX4_16150 [soil metagenome]
MVPSTDPYRSLSSREDSPGAEAELFYAPETRGLLAPGFGAFLASVVVGGLGGAAFGAACATAASPWRTEDAAAS